MADIEKLLEIESLGVQGVITGRALYTGDIDLKKCIELAEKAKKQESKEKQQSGAKF
jgi:phosphoribosylformimino-5-aminoimidazole carboxamide ribotide isomerase